MVKEQFEQVTIFMVEDDNLEAAAVEAHHARLDLNIADLPRI